MGGWTGVCVWGGGGGGGVAGRQIILEGSNLPVIPSLTSEVSTHIFLPFYVKK